MCAVNVISNNKIKEITKLHQKKYREDSNLFIAEGFKAVEELIDKNCEIIDIYSTKAFDFKTTIIEENQMKKIATTSSPCEILAIAKQIKTQTSELKSLKKIILLDSISDPGNLGTIIRSASAFGIEGIILFGDCVELYSPKVVRSATGNLFKTKITTVKNKEELKKIFPSHKLVATSLSKENNISIKDCKKFDKYIIMFGSEATGLSKELQALSDNNIKLEMTNNVESLNLSISASIILYELFTI